MKRILGGILATLIMAGCSAKPEAGPTPQTGGGGGTGPATKGRNICAALPGPEAAKALGATTAKADPDSSGACWYSDMPECEGKAARDCSFIAELETTKWQDPGDLWDPVPGSARRRSTSPPAY